MTIRKEKLTSPPVSELLYAEVYTKRTQMTTTSRSDVYYCGNMLIKRRSQASIGPVVVQELRPYTIRRNYGASPLYGRYYFPDRTSRIQHLQSEPMATHSADYSTYRTHPRNSQIGVYVHSNSSSTTFTDLVVKHQRGDTLFRLRTDGEETIDFHDYLLVCNAENTQATKDVTPNVHVFRKSDVENELITGRPDESSIKMVATKFIMVQPAELQATKGKLRTTEKLTVEQKKDANWCEEWTKVGKRASAFYADHTGILVRTSNIDGCLQIAVPVALRDRIFYAEKILIIAGYPYQ